MANVVTPFYTLTFLLAYVGWLVYMVGLGQLSSTPRVGAVLGPSWFLAILDLIVISSFLWLTIINKVEDYRLAFLSFMTFLMTTFFSQMSSTVRGAGAILTFIAYVAWVVSLGSNESTFLGSMPGMNFPNLPQRPVQSSNNSASGGQNIEVNDVEQKA